MQFLLQSVWPETVGLVQSLENEQVGLQATCVLTVSHQSPENALWLQQTAVWFRRLVMFMVKC